MHWLVGVIIGLAIVFGPSALVLALAWVGRRCAPLRWVAAAVGCVGLAIAFVALYALSAATRMAGARPRSAA